ncbi:unnamed protein product, partial [Allacma fusca]
MEAPTRRDLKSRAAMNLRNQMMIMLTVMQKRRTKMEPLM